MMVSELGFALYFGLRCAVDPAFEPQWGMTITGELETPIDMEGEA